MSLPDVPFGQKCPFRDLAGIARLARWHVTADVAAGRLVPLLEDFNPGDEEVTHAAYVGQGKHFCRRGYEPFSTFWWRPSN